MLSERVAYLGLGGLDGLDFTGDQLSELGEDLRCLTLGTGLVPMQVFASESICVLFTNNRLKCFGDNDKGQLGYGHTNA